MLKIELRTSVKIFFSSSAENLKTLPCSRSCRRDVGGGEEGGFIGDGGIVGDGGIIGGLGGIDGEIIWLARVSVSLS